MKSSPVFVTALAIALLAGCATSEPASERPAETVDVAAVDTQPVAIARTPPKYPMHLRSARVTGEVVIDFVVDTRGRVQGPRAVKASHKDFIAPAIAAVSDWRFRPAMVANKPVNCHLQIPVVFTLNDDQAEAGGLSEAGVNELPEGAAIYDIAELSRKPIASRRQPPRYPVSLRGRGIGGEAVIDFVVAADGTVANARVLRATAPEFGDAALEAVRAWRFQPGRKGDIAVNCHMQVPIVFSLNAN